MMPSFTFTRAPDPATPATDPLDPKENIDPDTTPPKLQRGDPNTLTRSTPRSTTLHRRFLKEVSMSPSPVRTRTPSPTKGRESPKKEKLEVGTTGFYFSCELPMSKVSPKKVQTGRESPAARLRGTALKDEGKMDGCGTPKRTLFSTPVLGSPVQKADRNGGRAGTPKKSTPARALFGTLARNATTMNETKGIEQKAETTQSHSRPPFGTPLRHVATPDAKNSLRASPTRSIKTAMSGTPKKATPVRAQFGTPLRNVTAPKNTGKTKTSPTKSTKMASWFNKGPVSAPRTSHAIKIDVEKEDSPMGKSDATAAPSSTSSPRPALNTIATPNPKPARGSSFNIGELMVGLKVHSCSTALVTRGGSNHVSAPPTPLRKASEKLGKVEVIVRSKSELESALIETDVTDRVDIPKAAEEHYTFVPFRIKEQTLQYRSLLLPKSESEVSMKTEDKTSTANTKHVNFQDFVARASDSPEAKTLLRPGTDPEVFQAMQEDMNILTRSLGNSLGVGVEFSGKENTSELPSMAKSLLESDQRSLSTSQPKPLMTRSKLNISNTSNSTTSSSMGMVRASMLMDPKQPSGSPALTKSAIACWPYAGKTSGRARKERMAAGKAKDLAEWQAEVKAQEQQKILGRATSNTTMAKPTTPRNNTIQSASSRAKVPPTVPRSKLSTPVKSKTAGSGIPRSARKSIFDSPSTKALTSTPKPRKPIATSPRPAPAPSFTPRKPQIPTRPVFASATDIADTVAQWNTKAPRPSNKSSPFKKPATPKLSPAKPASRAKSTPNLLSTLTPKRLAPLPPSTPATPRNPAIHRLRAPAPRTIATQRAFDPNAFRTPSKAIQGSLDRAIDEKIAEDRKRGRAGMGLGL